jgi:hypothetical protein
MKVTTLPWDLKATDFSEDTHNRSGGLHLGQVMDSIAEVLFPSPNKWEGEAAMTVGFLWENILAATILKSLVDKGLLVRPGEVTVDGIAMTPDGWDSENRILHEYKCTWKSCDKPIEDNWRYCTQIKSYCRAMATNRAHLYILYLMGNYRDIRQPVTRGYELEFSQRELDDNWNMIVKHSKKKGLL